MEKRTPHCPLSVVKTLIEVGKVRTTQSARTGAAALDLDYRGMLAVIQALTPGDFYKSMTTYADHRVWQDVYHAPAGDEGAVLYIKFQADVVTEFRVISFKEKSDGS